MTHTITQSPSGRKAFGPHRHRTDTEKARHVAESMLLHADDGRTKTLADYGIAEHSAQAQRVYAALAQLQGRD